MDEILPQLKGIELVDGTKDTFDINNLNQLNKLYFVRTSADNDNGFIYFNGKKYGVNTTVLNCGTY